MVTLIVDDLHQITMLEYLLADNGIEYTVTLDDMRYGLTPPYILVYGVPLDEKRAFQWIKEQCYE